MPGEEEARGNGGSGPRPERLRTSDDRAQAAALMAGAFRESPSYKHMLESRGEAKREVLLASLFEKNLALQKDACWCSRRPEDGSLQCTFLLTPSDAPPVSFFRMVRGGLLQLLLQWGLGPVGRLLRAKAWHERSYAEALGTRPHLVLERMAVSKNQRGGGIGTATLAGALAVDADAKGLPVVLTTQEARNVRFYRRLGFEGALEEEFPPGITNTIMVREPTL